MFLGIREKIAELYETHTAPSWRHLIATRQPLLWVLALFTGITGAYAILAFRFVIGEVQRLWIGYEAENIALTVIANKPAWLVMAGPVTVGAIVGVLLMVLTPGRRAEGMADVIAARARRGAKMPWQNGLMSAIISAISLGGGASAGREGPAVHIVASISSLLGAKFTLPIASRRVLLGCGAAAAVSASFNAPIAGVLFAHEVILGHYAMSAFALTIMASVSATIVTRLYLSNFPAFAIPTYQINSNWEFPAFLLLGIVAGLVATVLKGSIAAADKTARTVHMPLWARPIVGGLILGVLALAIPEILGVGYEATNLALREKYTSLSFLFTLLAAKIFAIAITLASRFGGGIFSPSLYIGAITGAAFGIIAGQAFPELASTPGVYATLGMGAIAGAVLGAPLSTVLIVFELTGGYDMTIALLLTVSIATITSKTLFGYSLFSWQLATRGIFIDHGPHTRIVKQWQVKDFVTPLNPDDDPDLEDFADRPILTPQDTMETALKAFAKGNFTRLAVQKDVKKPDTLIGWADHSSALAEYNKALIEANEEEHR